MKEKSKILKVRQLVESGQGLNKAAAGYLWWYMQSIQEEMHALEAASARSHLYFAGVLKDHVKIIRRERELVDLGMSSAATYRKRVEEHAKYVASFR